MNELLGYIQEYYPKANEIRVNTDIDFTKGFEVGELLIDDGRGLHPLSKRGDGTKRRMLMGIMDWDRQIISTLKKQTIIRGYDEPDSNLHYEAQHQMYSTISKSVGLDEEEESRIQTLICTHSLTMIDRAPARSINLLRLNELGVTEIDFIRTGDDEDIEDFLDWVARELGITNTMLFYERCYILIEGDAEENALPGFYRTLYNSSLIDDGIRLINLHGNGAWLPLLNLLGQNRQDLTLSLLDTDAKEDINKRFRQVKTFPESTLEQQAIWIGSQEFEDVFSDHVLSACLSKLYKRVDGRPWSSEDIQKIRARVNSDQKNAAKFSRELGEMVRRCCPGGTVFSKADLGYELGKMCTCEEIPEEIKLLFRKARRIAGMT